MTVDEHKLLRRIAACIYAMAKLIYAQEMLTVGGDSRFEAVTKLGEQLHFLGRAIEESE